MTAYMIGIDQSTQSTKAFLYTTSGKIAASAALPHRQIINEQGWLSHDLNEIWTNLLKVIKKLLIESGIDSKKIVSVGITNQRETSAAWSKSSGKPLGHAIVWQDARAKELCEVIAEQRPEAAATVQEKTGLPLSPYFPAAKFAWFMQNRASVIEAAQENDLCLGTIDSWLLFQLTRGQVFETEPSNASRTALLDLKTQMWDPTLCQLFGLPMQALPKVVDSDADFGVTDFNGLLSVPVPITGILGDSQAALFGQNGRKVGALKATYGTGSSIMVNVGELPLRSTAGLVSSIGWRQSGHTNYVLEGNINYTGALITWLKDGLHLIDDPGETESLAKVANSNDQTTIVPAFTGLGAPYWNDEAKAAILNMTSLTKRPEIVKAALDAIVFQIQAVIASVRPDIKQLSRQLKVDGGPTHNDYLMQRQSDISDLVIEVPDVENMSSFGAARLAGEKSGFFDSDKQYVAYRRYSPSLEKRSRIETLQRWDAAVKLVEIQSRKANTSSLP